MNAIRRLTVLCYAVTALASTAIAHPDEPRMFWVPLGDDPAHYPAGTTVVFAQQGDVVTMGIYVQGPDDTDFQSPGVQAFVDSVGTQVGSGVTSGGVEADCTYDGVHACGSVQIDQTRSDYVGFNTTSIDCSDCPNDGTPPYKFGWVVLNVPVSASTLPGNPEAVYFGQVDFVVSPDACGRFLFDFIGAPDLETVIIPDAGIVDGVFTPLIIVVEPPNDSCEDANDTLGRRGDAVQHDVRRAGRPHAKLQPGRVRRFLRIYSHVLCRVDPVRRHRRRRLRRLR